jgi:oxygen-independent coproporphyrinogen-3 oxidase
VLPRHLYLHVPFCARRCSYCDFAIAVRRTIPVDEFVDAIERELDLRFGTGSGSESDSDPDLSDAAQLETLYFGGGTPSKLGHSGIHRLMDAARARWTLSSSAEVTLEANPEDVSVEEATAWREAGVNRVSLGVQSFDDRVLTWMHRTHDAAQVERAVEAIRGAGMNDWSLDLIFALPAEVERSWSNDLARAVALKPPHLSCYGLTMEPHTPLVRWRDRGLVHEAEEDRYADEFLEADAVLAGAGYEHYEVSNYARDGAKARHNSAYWSHVPYAGVGPSAHSFDGTIRRWNEREFVAWQSVLAESRDPMAGSEVLNEDAVAIEEVYLGLRTNRGLPVARVGAGQADVWIESGWATLNGDLVRLTPSGWLRLDALVGALTDLRSRY